MMRFEDELRARLPWSESADPHPDGIDLSPEERDAVTDAVAKMRLVAEGRWATNGYAIGIEGARKCIRDALAYLDTFGAGTIATAAGGASPNPWAASGPDPKDTT